MLIFVVVNLMLNVLIVQRLGKEDCVGLSVGDSLPMVMARLQSHKIFRNPRRRTWGLVEATSGAVLHRFAKSK